MVFPHVHICTPREDRTEQDLTVALNDLVTRKYANIKSEQTKDIAFIPQKLADVQLGLSGNDTTHRLPMIGYYFLIILAAVIMLTACFNYTNLSVARALTRAKEIGVRKVTGAKRSSIVFQFLSESMLTSLLALIMATRLLYLLAPSFKNLWVNNYLNFELPSSVEFNKAKVLVLLVPNDKREELALALQEGDMLVVSLLARADGNPTEEFSYWDLEEWMKGQREEAIKAPQASGDISLPTPTPTAQTTP